MFDINPLKNLCLKNTYSYHSLDLIQDKNINKTANNICVIVTHISQSVSQLVTDNVGIMHHLH